MLIDNKFEIGETVYLKTDTDQLARVVFGFYVTRGEIIYELACGVNTSKHFDFEISTEKDVLKTVE